VGAGTGTDAQRHSFLGTYRTPEFIAAFAENPGPRHLDSDFEMVQDTFPLLRREGDQAARRARPPRNADVPEDLIAGSQRWALRAQRPGRVRGFSEGGDGEYMGMVVRHRGAQSRFAGHRRFADHPARDPHPCARQGWDGGAEAGVVAQAGDCRGDGGGRGDRARLRQRRRRDQGHRHRGHRPRRCRRLRDQRRERRGARSAHARTS
jgi:hypothetical protein